MKPFLSLIGLHLGRWLRRPSFLLALFLPVLLIVAIGLLLPKTAEQTLIVGIFIEEDSPLAEEFWEELIAVQTPPVSFVRAESAVQLEQMVAATLWECGYALPSDFEARLDQGSYRQLFTRVVSPATNLQMLSNSAISAAFLSLVTEDIAAAYLEEKDILSQDDFFRLVEANTISAAPFSAQFDIETTGGTLQNARSATSATSVNRGVLSIGLFLYFALAAVSLGQDSHSGFFTRIAPIAGRRRVSLAGPVAILLTSVVSAAAMFFAALWADPSLALHPLREALALLLYLLYLTALSYAASAFLSKGSSVFALLPFLLLASILLSPVFVDIPRYLPALHPVSCLLPPTLYFRAADGSLWAMAWLAAGTLIFSALGTLRSRRIH